MLPSKVIIDEEFKYLLPALDDKTFKGLEDEIVKDGGCRDPLVLWDGVLIDGHNRYTICQKHNISFNIVDYTSKFSSREEVMIWIISTQISRRNLTNEQMVYFRGKQYEMEKSVQGTNNQYVQKSENRQNDDFQNHELKKQTTAERLAEQYHVAPRTIERDAKVAKAIDEIGKTSPVAKQKILSGEVDINKKELEKLSIKPEEEIKKVAQEINEGTYKKPEAQKSMLEKLGMYSFIIGGVTTLDNAVKQIKDDLDKHLKDVHEKSERNDIKQRLQKQVSELSKLIKLL